MKMQQILYYGIAACFAVAGAILLIPSCLYYLFLVFITLFSIVGGFSTVFYVHVKLSPAHKPAVGADNVFREIEKFQNKLMKEYEPQNKKPQPRLPAIFGRSVDSILQQILDFLIRDYIYIYLKDLAFDADILCDSVKEDMWGVIQTLHERLTRIDQPKLITTDIVNIITNHFERIRIAKSEAANNQAEFILSPHVYSQEQELEFLRKLSELLIMFLLPRSYSLAPTKYFVREVLTCQVLFPTIDTLTDPDFFNTNIITYIESQKLTASTHAKAFEGTGSIEDLLKIICKSTDVEELKSIRYNIVTKLMQATTRQNLHRARGLDPDLDQNSGANKTEINAAKKLWKHVNQLTFAKKECDKKLSSLGWDSEYQFNDDHRVLPLSSILEHVLGRKYLTQFLETLASQDLVRYWIAVEDLKVAQRKNWHQLGAEIFYTFIRNVNTEIKVDKDTRKRMEAFLLGDKGPEVFYEVQRQVVHTLEDKYYQSFLISDYYKEMINAIEREDVTEVDSQLGERQSSNDSNTSIDNNLNVGDHSNYARRRLDQLEEKLANKTQALEALRASWDPESRILSVLEKEVQWLQGEKRQLEAHLYRTEIWGENLGKWRAVVQSAEICEEIPQFVLVVHMMENDTMEGEESISTGWVVSRSLNQFQELHRKLRPLCSQIRSLELPSNTFKFLFGKTDKFALERAKQQIQTYLNFILTDDRLNSSEAIYSFLSPSSEHLKHSSPSPKKSKFSFATLFKSGSESKDGMSVLRETEDDDVSLFLDPPSSTDTIDFTKSNGQSNRFGEDTRETAAEPFFALLSEIFDMRGVLKVVRKSLIAFVQITYGRNINRQIHDTVAWYFSEQMLHYYLTLFLKSFWPGGTLAKPSPARSPEDKERAAKLAQELFVNNTPDILVMVVGSNTAKLGAKKIFDALQSKNMNKQLFYEILGVTVDTIFPELS